MHRVKDFEDRAAWDRALTASVAEHQPDLVVSAGFMKLVGPAFLAAFGGRLVNTHPALSPAFPGMHGAADALAYGVKVTGCTLFFVDEGVDTGPIVAQSAVPVADDDTAETLHERIKVAERELLVDTVGADGARGLHHRGQEGPSRTPLRDASRSAGRSSRSTTSPGSRSWSAGCTTRASRWCPPAARPR